MLIEILHVVNNPCSPNVENCIGHVCVGPMALVKFCIHAGKIGLFLVQ